MFLAFVIFNLTIFAVATVSSYAAHPMGADLVMVGRKRLGETRKAHERVRTALGDVQNRRATLFAKHETEARRIGDQFLELVKRYMMSNVRARGGAGINGSARPGSFLTELTVSLELAQPWTLSTPPSQRGPEGIGPPVVAPAQLPGALSAPSGPADAVLNFPQVAANAAANSGSSRLANGSYPA